MSIGMALRPRGATAPALLERLAAAPQQIPLLLLWGRQDRFVPLMLGERLQQQHQWLELHVIDNKTVITGSFNWSPSAAHTNDETLLVIHSPQLAKHFAREMDRLWESAELGITPRIQRKLERQKIGCGDGAMRQ